MAKGSKTKKNKGSDGKGKAVPNSREQAPAEPETGKVPKVKARPRPNPRSEVMQSDTAQQRD